MKEFLNSKGVQAYLFLTAGIWLVALSMINGGAARSDNPAWGFISGIRWALSAPLILAVIIGTVFYFGDREAEQSNSEKDTDVVSAPKRIEALPTIKIEYEPQIPTSTSVAALIPATSIAKPNPAVEIETPKPAQSPDEAVATALEDFL